MKVFKKHDFIQVVVNCPGLEFSSKWGGGRPILRVARLVPVPDPVPALCRTHSWDDWCFKVFLLRSSI